MDLFAHFSDTGFLANIDRMAVYGHEEIYGGDEDLRHHLCLRYPGGDRRRATLVHG